MDAHNHGTRNHIRVFLPIVCVFFVFCFFHGFPNPEVARPWSTPASPRWSWSWSLWSPFHTGHSQCIGAAPERGGPLKGRSRTAPVESRRHGGSIVGSTRSEVVDLVRFSFRSPSLVLGGEFTAESNRNSIPTLNNQGWMNTYVDSELEGKVEGQSDLVKPQNTRVCHG